MEKILIVEDDSALRELYKNIFLNATFEVEETGDRNRAIQLIKVVKYDIILLDLLFPSGDSLQILREIRSNNSMNTNTPVVVLTNLDNGRKAKKALELGADKYLFKARNTPKSILEEVRSIIKNN